MKKTASAVDAAILNNTQRAALAALEKQADNLLILRVTELTSYADYFIICTGRSTQHVSAIADEIEQNMKDGGVRALGIEGRSDAHWILMDYGDFLIHVFEPETREYYNLEGLWLDAPRVAVPTELSAPREAKALAAVAGR